MNPPEVSHEREEGGDPTAPHQQSIIRQPAGSRNDVLSCPPKSSARQTHGADASCVPCDGPGPVKPAYGSCPSQESREALRPEEVREEAQEATTIAVAI